METTEGVRLLLRGYREHEIQQRHQSVASSIVERLGNLALAIDQAAAYIMYKRLPLDRLEEFLSTFETERQKFLSYTPKNFWEYEHVNAFTTWELSFQQLGSDDSRWKRNAAHFLTLSAFFAPTTITESIFRDYQQSAGSEVVWTQMFAVADEVQYDKNDRSESENEVEAKGKDDNEEEEDDRAESRSSGGGSHGTWDPDRFWDVVARSDDLSLLQCITPGMGQEGASFSLHPLIRDWLQLRLKPKERAKYTQEAIEVLGNCAATYDSRSTTLTERSALITHMDVSLSNNERFLEPQDRLGHRMLSFVTANWFADVYKNVGRYHTSEALTRRTVETLRSQLGENHPATLKSMNNHAVSLYHLSKFEEAEPIFRRTLMLSEKELGLNHRVTQFSMNGVANVLRDTGRYEEAEELFRKVLTSKEMLLGKKDPDTLSCMRNFAVLLSYRKKYEEAEWICRETVSLLELVCGKEHLTTLKSMNLLAWLIIIDQNKQEEAERIGRETLSLAKLAVGKEHPNTLEIMGNLAMILNWQNKNEEAERICRETLTLRERILGEEHPDTRCNKNQLASIMRDQGKYEEADLIAGVTETRQESDRGGNNDNAVDQEETSVIEGEGRE